ncbi:anti-apoptotic protein NR13-like [Petromyzon marinus]|uniref:Anti-apoptotic protein NR13-like n=1 Tax=Petromyzon marinus TaxID=7757 RepID=A0AAJ7TXH2_PETMA|nr:anti-apoptotic protein NR13-like [Petromyzon marinus]
MCWMCRPELKVDSSTGLTDDSSMEPVGDSLTELTQNDAIGAMDKGSRTLEVDLSGDLEVDSIPPQVVADPSSGAGPPSRARPLPSPPLVLQTPALVRHLLLWTMEPSGGHRAPSAAAEALEAAALEMTSRFGATLAQMAVAMEAAEGPVGSTGDVERTLRAVAERMFEDRVTNWGRIVSVVVFAGFVARRATLVGVAVDAEALAEAVSRYLLETHGAWMSKHGGWEGCASQLRGASPEDALWSGLLKVVGIGFGIGVLLTTWRVLRGI